MVSTQNDGPTYFQPQRKVLKSDSYYWVFFSNATYLDYCSSSDGSTWSNPTAIRTSAAGSSSSFRYAKISGIEYIYYAYANNTISNDIFFCRGTISGSSISFGTEYSIRKVTGEYEMYPDVEIASDGTVYVVSGAYFSTFARLYTRVFKNVNNDGSGAWSTSLTVTWVLSGATAEDSIVSALTALNSSMVYVISYTDRTMVAKGYLYNSTWSSVETILSGEMNKNFGIASFNNTVYFAYAYVYVRYCKVRDPTAGWGSAETISSVGGTGTGVQLCADNSNGDVYAFWGAVSNITYCKRSGTWGTVTYWKTSETNLLTPSITCYPAVINNEIAVVWSKGEAGTIYVMFDLLTLAPAKAWYDVSSWTASLATKTWSSGTSFSFDLTTRIWIGIATTSTFYITTGGNDGDVYGQNEYYAVAHDVPYATYDYAVDEDVGQLKYGPLYTVYRTFLKFDTSAIPLGATITNASLELYGDPLYDFSDVDFIVNLQKWTDDTPLTLDDFNEFDGINYDDGNYNSSGFVKGAYNTITISNFDLITKDGNTLICVRSSKDVSSTPPTQSELLNFMSYEGGHTPELSVTWKGVSLNLLTRQYISVASWLFDFWTRTWADATTWIFNLPTSIWNIASTWLFYLSPPQWVNVAVWIFSLTSPEWMLVALWNLQLGAGGIAFLFIAILLLIMIVTGIIIVAYRRPKR
jgi:hypothetical protein